MEMRKEDLGLSLSLSFPGEISRRVATTMGTTSDASRRPMMTMQLNLMPSSVQPCASSSSSAAYRKNPRTEAFASSDRSSGDVRSFLRGIDVNRAPPSTAECEEEAGVSSPNSTISSVSGKRSEGDANCEDRDAERASSRGISDEEDGENSRKKLRLTKDQSSILEESFKEHHTLNPKQKVALAKRLNLRARQVEVWFQNRRARTKLKQTEVDCEFLKRCCENLTEENRRLHKEAMELRALKLSPQFYMKMAPPTTLTMCPSCERVSGPPPSAQPHALPIGPAQHRPIPVNPWGPAAPVSHHPSTALHLRS